MLYSIRTYLICLTSTIDSALSPPQFAHSTFLVLPTLLSPSLPSSPSTVEESRFWMALCKARGRVGDTSQHANNLINSLKKLVLLSNLLDQIPSWTFGAIVFMCSVCNVHLSCAPLAFSNQHTGTSVGSVWLFFLSILVQNHLTL